MTKYCKAPYSDELLTIMKSPNVKYNQKKLDLPPSNHFIPKNLDVLAKQPELSTKPVLLKKWEDTDLWFMKDDKFERPKSIVNCRIYTNDCMFGLTDKGKIFANVWNSVLNETLREFFYMAGQASLHAHIGLSHDTINLEWAGFNDSMNGFISETLQQIKTVKMSEQKDYFD